MNQRTFDNLVQSVTVIEQEIQENANRHTIQASATDEVIEAALHDREAQNQGIASRITALENDASAKDAECRKLAGLMTAAYGRQDKAAATTFEAQYDQAQRDLDSLYTKIQQMKEATPQITINNDLVDNARKSLLQLIRDSGVTSREFIRTGEQLGKIIEKLEQIKDNVERKADAARRAPDRNDRKDKMIEIVENNEGPIDVTGHSCGNDREAKIRYSLQGCTAPGLESIPMNKVL